MTKFLAPALLLAAAGPLHAQGVTQADADMRRGQADVQWTAAYTPSVALCERCSTDWATYLSYQSWYGKVSGQMTQDERDTVTGLLASAAGKLDSTQAAGNNPPWGAIQWMDQAYDDIQNGIDEIEFGDEAYDQSLWAGAYGCYNSAYSYFTASLADTASGNGQAQSAETDLGDALTILLDYPPPGGG